jgi:hypothetical protein
MKYILSESKFNSIINKIFNSHYNESLIKYQDDEGYLLFIPESEITPYLNKNIKKLPDHLYNNSKFERNLWGMLWVNDIDLIEKIISILSISEEETKIILLDYFEDKYDIRIKNVTFQYPDN